MPKTDVSIVPAEAHHAFVLSTTMRPKDVRELAACGQTPLGGLLYAMEGSEAWAVLYDDVVGAMFGVRPVASPALGSKARGELWLLTGALFGEKPIAFARAARRAVAALLTRYDELVNVVDSRYPEAIRFVVGLGASLGRTVLIGDVPFVAFIFRRA